MIVSASRRTDIPCYYSEWFIKRLKAGFVITRNPRNNAHISRLPLLRCYNSHNPNSEMLIGSIAKGEKITDRKGKSNKQQQISLF